MVKATDEEGREETLFYGTIQETHIFHENGVGQVILTAASESVRMDMRKRSRSFQDTSLSCAEVMRGIVSEYGGTLDCEDSPMKIGAPMVQYEETDWEFCRRLAGRMGWGLFSCLVNMNRNETCIGKIIYSKLPIEWMRYNMYIEDDRYRNIPMLVFRLQESCPENLVDTLKECVENFKGKISWKVFRNPMTRKANYLLSISGLEDLYMQSYLEQIQYNQIEYFGTERYKKFCDDAILDIPMLAKHIAETL